VAVAAAVAVARCGLVLLRTTLLGWRLGLLLLTSLSWPAC
jgi:hypothetical protein